jgi:hypothetical protein
LFWVREILFNEIKKFIIIYDDLFAKHCHLWQCGFKVFKALIEEGGKDL